MQDYGAHIFERIQRGILAGVTVPIIFDTNARGGTDLSVPDEWRLEEFFDHFTMPPEIFDPQIFHGRGFAPVGNLFDGREMPPDILNLERCTGMSI